MALLSYTIVLPTLGALLLALIPNRDGSRDGLVRQLALGISLVGFALTLALWRGFDVNGAEFQFVERTMWIGVFNVE